MRRRNCNVGAGQSSLLIFSFVFLSSYLYPASLTKSGAGTLTLYGDSNGVYSGDTFITAGTLALSGSGAVPSNGTTSISLGAFLDITASSVDQVLGGLSGTGQVTMGMVNLSVGDFNISSSFSGTFSAGGNLTKIGTGVFTLSSNNPSFSGSVDIQNGTFALSGSGALPATCAVAISNGAIFDISSVTGAGTSIGNLDGVSGSSVVLGSKILTSSVASGSAQFDGVISGVGGALVKAGAGTWILDGANTYSGGTTVQVGVLQGTTSSLQGAIVNQASLVFNQSFDGTYASILSGSGTMTKLGAGTVTLEGATATQTSLAVNGGAVLVNESLTADVTIGSAGAMYGSGPIYGDVTNNGTAQPGPLEVVGEMIIFGTYVQGANSSLSIDITPTSNDLLTVNQVVGVGGTVAINATGTSLILTPELGDYPSTSFYTIVTAEGGVTGQFANVVSTLPSFNLQVNYNANSITLGSTIVPFSRIVTQGNAARVAKYLESIPVYPGSDLSDVVALLQNMSEAQLYAAFNQMQPSLFNALYLTQQAILIDLKTILEDRLRLDCANRCGQFHGVRLWSAYLYDGFKQNHIHGETGFRTRLQVGALGADYSFSQPVCLGVSLGAESGHLDWNSHRGHSTIEGLYPGLYFQWNPCPIYVESITLFGWSRYDATRNIDLISTTSQMYRVAKHKSYGWSGSTSLEGGFVLGKDFRFNPFMKADYIFAHLDPFKEHGANSIDLQVRKQFADMTRFEWGVEFSVCYKYKNWGFYPRVGGGWIIEERYNGTYSTANFVGSPGQFTVKGMKPNRELLELYAGADLLIGQLFQLSVAYDRKLSSRFREFSWIGELAFRF